VPAADVVEYLAAAGVSGSGLFSFIGDNEGAKQLIREWRGGGGGGAVLAHQSAAGSIQQQSPSS
jgi:hypothetical protein